MASHIRTFVVTFAITFGVALAVNFLWNVIGHGESTVEWSVPFRFAIILGVVLTWIEARDRGRDSRA